MLGYNQFFKKMLIQEEVEVIQFTTKEGIYAICKLLIIKEISKTNNSQHLVPFQIHIDLFTLFNRIFCLDQIVTFFHAVF